MSEGITEAKVLEERKKATKPAAKFTKEKLLSAQGYIDKRDLINALAEDGKEYTKAEIERLIDDYLAKVVK